MAFTYKGMTPAVQAAQQSGDQVVAMGPTNVQPLLIAWLLVVTNERFWNPAKKSKLLLAQQDKQKIADQLGLTVQTIQYLIDTANDAAGVNQPNFSAIGQIFSTMGQLADYGDLGCPDDYAAILKLAAAL